MKDIKLGKFNFKLGGNKPEPEENSYEEPTKETGGYHGRFAAEDDYDDSVEERYSARSGRGYDGRFDSPYDEDNRSDYRGRYSARYDERFSDPYADEEDRYDNRYEDRYNDRYDDRYDDRYSNRFEDPYQDRYDDRFGADDDMDDDRYGRYSDRYADRGDEPEEDYAPRRGDGKATASERFESVVAYVDRNDWVMYASMVILPPLGIYLLWRRGRFEEKLNRILMGITAVWFIVLLVMIINLSRGGAKDPTSSIVIQTVAPTEAPVVEVLETPEPTAEPEPVETPAPEATAEPEMVYATTTGRFYHKNTNCSLAGSTEPLTQITLENAQNRNLYECPECYGLDKYYATENGTYYHKDEHCSGMVRASVHSLESAKATGKQPCPKCVPAEVVETVTTETEPVEEMQPLAFLKAGMKDKSGIKVFRTKGGTYFHTQSDCSNMKNAATTTLGEALIEGKVPCPICAAEYRRSVYMTEGGKSFHATSNCNGMKDASLVSLAEALAMGKSECATCKPISSMSDDELRQKQREEMYYVYSTKTNDYYHINSACGGMTDATKVTLSDMLKQGRQPCPVCCAGANTTVYLSESTNTYHSEPTCSGLTDGVQTTLAEALANGYSRCPKCWADGMGVTEGGTTEEGTTA